MFDDIAHGHIWKEKINGLSALTAHKLMGIAFVHRVHQSRGKCEGVCLTTKAWPKLAH